MTAHELNRVVLQLRRLLSQFRLHTTASYKTVGAPSTCLVGALSMSKLTKGRRQRLSLYSVQHQYAVWRNLRLNLYMHSS
jgi:hypothetical protein